MTGSLFKATASAFLILVICANAILLGCGSEPQNTEPPVDFTATEKLREIRSEILNGSRFSVKDRTYTLSFANRDTIQSVQALLTLEMATRKGLFSEADLNKLIKNKIRKAEPLDVPVYLDQVWLDLELDGKPTISVEDKYKALMRTSDRTTLTLEERDFVISSLASTEFGNRRLAADLLCSKSKMDSVDLKWSLFEIDSNISMVTGNELKFWQFVRSELPFKFS